MTWYTYLRGRIASSQYTLDMLQIGFRYLRKVRMSLVNPREWAVHSLG
jgi:hypothetical protein